MALNNIGIGFALSAQDQASAVIQRLTGKFEQLGAEGSRAAQSIAAAFKGMGRDLATAGVGVGGLAAAFNLAGRAGEFNEHLRQAGAIAGATTEQLRHLRDVSFQTSMQRNDAAATEVAETLKMLQLEGYNAEDALATLNPTLDLMAVSMGAISREQAAGLLNDNLGEFGMQANQAAEFVDKFAFATRSLGFQANELGPALTGIARGANLAGASFDDSLLLLGLLKTKLPAAGQAASQANAAFMQLSNPAVLKKLGGMVSVVDKVTGKQRSWGAILTDLAKKTEKMTEAQRAQFLMGTFGGKSAGGLTIALDALKEGVTSSTGEVLKGAAAIEYLTNSISNSQGVAEDIRKRSQQGIGFMGRAIQRDLATIGTQIGEAFEEALLPVLEVVKEVTGFIKGLINTIPEPFKVFAARGLVVMSTILLTLGAFRLFARGLTLIKGLLGLTSEATKEQGKAASFLGAMFEKAAAAVDSNVGAAGRAAAGFLKTKYTMLDAKLALWQMRIAARQARAAISDFAGRVVSGIKNIPHTFRLAVFNVRLGVRQIGNFLRNAGHHFRVLAFDAKLYMRQLGAAIAAQIPKLRAFASALPGAALRRAGGAVSWFTGKLFSMWGLLAVAGTAFAALRKHSDKAGKGGESMWGKFKLGYDGLMQLFTTGELSGAVAKALREPSNKGVLNVLVRIWNFGQKVVDFFDGMAEGFARAIAANSGTFDKFGTALSKLLDAFGRLLGITSDTQGGVGDVGKSGERMGVLLGNAISRVIDGLTFVIDTITRVVNWLDSLDPSTRKWLLALGAVAFFFRGPLMGAIMSVATSGFSALASGALGAAAKMGPALLTALGPIALVAAGLAGLVSIIKQLHDNWDDIRYFFEGMPVAVNSKQAELNKKIEAAGLEFHEDPKTGVITYTKKTKPTAASAAPAAAAAAAAGTSSPGIAAVPAGAGNTPEQLAAMQRAQAATAAELKRVAGRPINVNVPLVVDGQTLATVQKQVSEGNAHRGYSGRGGPRSNQGG